MPDANRQTFVELMSAQKIPAAETSPNAFEQFMIEGAAESALRKAEGISAQPMPQMRLSTGKRIGGEQPPEQPTQLTGEETVEFRLRQQLPEFINEQIDTFYEHPGRTLLETGVTTAAPELAAAKWGITVPGRMMVRGISGGVSGIASSLAAETFDPTENPLSHALTVGAYSALGETAGEMLATGSNVLLGRGRRLEPGAREAFEELRGVAIPSPATMSKSPWADVIENVTHSTVFGHAPIQNMRDAAEAASQLKLERFVSEYVGDQGEEAVGGTLQEAIELSNQFYKRAGNKFYNVLFGLADAAKVQGEVTGKLPVDSGIPADRLLRAVKEMRKKWRRSPTAEKAAKWVIDEIGDKKTIGLREAHSLRSDLRGLVSPPDEPLPEKAKMAPVQLVRLLTREMKRHATELGPDIARQLDIADTYWGALHEVFGDKFIRALLKAEPETVLKKVTPPEMPGTVRRIRNIVLDPNLKDIEKIESHHLWEQVQGHVMLRVARQAEDADLEVIGKKGFKALRRYWDETLDELFVDKTALERFKQLLNTLRVSQGTIGKGIPGGIATRLLQAGILFNAAPEPGRVARLFVPVFLAKRLFTNETFVRWAIVGSKAPRGSFLATRALTQMQAVLMAEQKMMEREKAMIDSVKRTQRAQGVTQ